MRWTLIDYNPESITELHATEDALFELLSTGGITPTILISQLRNKGITLSANQSIEDVRLDEAIADGIDVLRRKTGGRAMLLGPKYLILSFFAQESQLQTRGVHDSYSFILTNYIVAPLESVFGIKATIENVNDLVCDGKKFGGAAQKKAHDSILVHCYIRLEEDNHEMVRYVTLGGIPLEPYVSQIDDFAQSISTITQRNVFLNSLRSAIVQNIDHEPRELTPDEMFLSQMKAEEYTRNEALKALPTEGTSYRGHCDIIGGSGAMMYYKIPELETLVKEKGMNVR
jgi:lipoate-protein ligase A